jgi:hypothetical protein
LAAAAPALLFLQMAAAAAAVARDYLARAALRLRQRREPLVQTMVQPEEQVAALVSQAAAISLFRAALAAAAAATQWLHLQSGALRRLAQEAEAAAVRKTLPELYATALQAEHHATLLAVQAGQLTARQQL